MNRKIQFINQYERSARIVECDISHETDREIIITRNGAERRYQKMRQGGGNMFQECFVCQNDPQHIFSHNMSEAAAKGPGPDHTTYILYYLYGHQFHIRPVNLFPNLRESKEVIQEVLKKEEFLVAYKKAFKSWWNNKIGGDIQEQAYNLALKLINDDIIVLRTLVKIPKYYPWVLYCLLNIEPEGSYQIFSDIDDYNKAIGLFDSNLRSINNKDIFRFKSLGELRDFLESKGLSQAATGIDMNQVREMVVNHHIKEIHNDNKYQILVPRNEHSCVYLGKGTEWCTSKYGEGDNRTSNAISRYNLFSNDPQNWLYVIVDKHNGKRYGVQLKNGEFKNKFDEEVTDLNLKNEILNIIHHSIRDLQEIRKTFKRLI